MESAKAALLPLGRMTGMKQEQELARMELRLQALDPFEPPRRGYALACDEKGEILRSVTGTAPGRTITVHLADGRILGTVTEVSDDSLPTDASR